jgi:hypothetical protein
VATSSAVNAVGSAAPDAAAPDAEAVSARRVSTERCTPTSCDYRTEACCEADPNRMLSGCVKKSKMPNPDSNGHKCYGELGNDWIGIECLTTEDCPAGLSCCIAAEITHCAAECEEHEACVLERPTTCHAGSKCVASSSRSGGSCVVASPGARCGATRCSGAKPACRYDLKKRRGECIALTPEGNWPDGSMKADVALMQCGGPSDCAGERCCTGGPLVMTECSGMCMSGIDVCETVQDCPYFLGPPTGCTADAGGPAFLKTCDYASQ